MTPEERRRSATEDSENPQRDGWRPATLAAQALGEIEPSFGGTTPAIYPAVTFERDADLSYPRGPSYGRDENPTYLQVERLLTQLEGGADALLFSSGMAAAAAIVDTLPVGAGVVAPQQMYWGLRRWLRTLAARDRIRLQLIAAGDLDALHQALSARPALVWLETPANPTCEITDLEASCEASHSAGAVVAVDNTLPTPVLTRPLRHGADLVMHSATKLLNGHSDVLAGAVVGARVDDLWQAVRGERAHRGSVLGPFEAWLLLRGMRTLYLRVSYSCASAARIAATLAEHPAVSEVFYPGLSSHPGHRVASRQMTGGYGQLLSFRLRGGEETAVAVAARLRCFVRATSLGGVESLVEHRASVEGDETLLPSDLLRLSVGIEDPQDLIDDLLAALADAPG